MAFERLGVKNHYPKTQVLETMSNSKLRAENRPLTSTSCWSLAEAEAGQGDAGGQGQGPGARLGRACWPAPPRPLCEHVVWRAAGR